MMSNSFGIDMDHGDEVIYEDLSSVYGPLVTGAGKGNSNGNGNPKFTLPFTNATTGAPNTNDGIHLDLTLATILNENMNMNGHDHDQDELTFWRDEPMISTPPPPVGAYEDESIDPLMIHSMESGTGASGPLVQLGSFDHCQLNMAPLGFAYEDITRSPSPTLMPEEKPKVLDPAFAVPPVEPAQLPITLRIITNHKRISLPAPVQIQPRPDPEPVQAKIDNGTHLAAASAPTNGNANGHGQCVSQGKHSGRGRGRPKGSSNKNPKNLPTKQQESEAKRQIKSEIATGPVAPATSQNSNPAAIASTNTTPYPAQSRFPNTSSQSQSQARKLKKWEEQEITTANRNAKLARQTRLRQKQEREAQARRISSLEQALAQAQATNLRQEARIKELQNQLAKLATFAYRAAEMAGPLAGQIWKYLQGRVGDGITHVELNPGILNFDENIVFNTNRHFTLGILDGAELNGKIILDAVPTPIQNQNTNTSSTAQVVARDLIYTAPNSNVVREIPFANAGTSTEGLPFTIQSTSTGIAMAMASRNENNVNVPFMTQFQGPSDTSNGSGVVPTNF